MGDNVSTPLGMRARLRSWLDLVATLAIIAASAGLLWNLARGSDGRAQRPERPQIPVPQEPIALEGGQVIGNAAAPAVMIEFTDFECPFCQRFAQEALPAIKSKYIDSGRLRLVLRHHPLSGAHPHAWEAAEAAECAGSQNRFWEMHDVLFRVPAKLTRPDLEAAAAGIGVEARQFGDCLRQGTMTARVQRDSDAAKALQLLGTPAFLFGRTQPDQRVKIERALAGALPLREFTTVIDAVLK